MGSERTRKEVRTSVLAIADRDLLGRLGRVVVGDGSNRRELREQRRAHAEGEEEEEGKSASALGLGRPKATYSGSCATCCDFFKASSNHLGEGNCPLLDFPAERFGDGHDGFGRNRFQNRRGRRDDEPGLGGNVGLRRDGEEVGG